MSGVNPQGCQVSRFKQPSAEELDHDFLWRITKALPERGRIGIFNRSYYEEVLVAARPSRLARVASGCPEARRAFWQQRYDDINAFERHLARNGTRIVKFFLHVSKESRRSASSRGSTSRTSTGSSPPPTSRSAPTGTTTWRPSKTP